MGRISFFVCPPYGGSSCFENRNHELPVEDIHIEKNIHGKPYHSLRQADSIRKPNFGSLA